MTWVRLDDSFPSHRKVRRCSDAAFRFHVSALCWASQYLTDGHISTEDAELIVNDLDDARDPQTLKEVTENLVRAGMWHSADHDCQGCPTSNNGGWVIHDYLDINPSAEQVAHHRHQAAERQRRARERGSSDQRMHDGESRGESKPSRRDASVSHGDGTRKSRLPIPIPIPIEEQKKNPLPPSRKNRATGEAKPPLPVDETFDRFWTTYPLRTAKPAAVKAWAKARQKVGDPQVLIDAAARYRDDPNREPRFTAHPSTWLNNERWNDDPLPVDGSRASPNGGGYQPYRDNDDPNRYKGDLWP